MSGRGVGLVARSGLVPPYKGGERPAEMFARGCAVAASGGDSTTGANTHAGAVFRAAEGGQVPGASADAPRAPKRIQRRRAKGWKLPAGAVCVGRGTRWGNPFVVGRDGSAEECTRMYATLLAGSICLSAKAEIAEQKGARAHVLAHVDELRGRDLACWCREGVEWCHGDVLLALANRPLSCEAAP